MDYNRQLNFSGSQLGSDFDPQGIFLVVAESNGMQINTLQCTGQSCPPCIELLAQTDVCSATVEKPSGGRKAVSRILFPGSFPVELSSVGCIPCLKVPVSHKMEALPDCLLLIEPRSAKALSSVVPLYLHLCK